MFNIGDRVKVKRDMKSAYVRGIYAGSNGKGKVVGLPHYGNSKVHNPKILFVVLDSKPDGVTEFLSDELERIYPVRDTPGYTEIPLEMNEQGVNYILHVVDGGVQIVAYVPPNTQTGFYTPVKCGRYPDQTTAQNVADRLHPLQMDRYEK